MKIYEALSWYPTIGDPTFMGWLTVFLYFFVSVACFRYVFLSSVLFSDDVAIKQKQFWLFMALILFAWGINKQLDLQSMLTAVGKYYAHRDGWYEHRRVIQVSLIIGILLSMSVMISWFLFYMRAILKTNWLAVVGVSFLLMFVMVRATSFHHMDILINTTILGVRMNWVLELGGIVCIGYSALFSYKKNKMRID